jgi:glycosyltransferase involved in cell wall biosynthesis
MLDRLLLRCFDRVVAVSDSTRARLSGGQALEEKLSIIGNGVEMPELSGAQASAANGHSSMVVGVAARLSREKGVEIFLRAAAEVAGIHPGTRFVIAGDGPERPHLETLAKELGLVSRVTFLGFCSNIGSFLSGLNIFVQPSLVDAMPMSVLEAMAHGLPVIAAAVGAIPEILGQRERGVLFPAGDVSSLAGRILDLSNDAGLRSHLGGEARCYVAEHCSAAAMAERYRSVYQQAREERSVAAALAAV